MVRMTKYIDKHKGKRIWVCGTGPSLLDVKEELLTDDIVIACNSAIKHFSIWHYWLMIDGMMRYVDYIDSARPDIDVILLNEDIKPKNGRLDYILQQSGKWGDWRVYKDRHFPGNSTHRAVSFAYCMGARAIILAGCDAIGNHPYDPEQDAYEQPFNEDIMLWNAMIEHNPNLPIWTISQLGKTQIPSLTFQHALYL